MRSTPLLISFPNVVCLYAVAGLQPTSQFWPWLSSRWYLCARKSPYALHPVSWKFSNVTCLYVNRGWTSADQSVLAVDLCMYRSLVLAILSMDTSGSTFTRQVLLIRTFRGSRLLKGMSLLNRLRTISMFSPVGSRSSIHHQ